MIAHCIASNSMHYYFGSTLYLLLADKMHTKRSRGLLKETHLLLQVQVGQLFPLILKILFQY